MSKNTTIYDAQIKAAMRKLEQLKQQQAQEQHLLDIAPEVVKRLRGSEVHYEGTGDEILKKVIADIERLRELKREERSERARAAAARRAAKKNQAPDWLKSDAVNVMVDGCSDDDDPHADDYADMQAMLHEEAVQAAAAAEAAASDGDDADRPMSWDDIVGD